jgi:cation transporter-like permease
MMSQESDTTLRKSLDAVDRFRRRAIAAVILLFAVIVLALGSLMGAATARAGGSAGQAKILFTSVVAQMVFVSLCTVVVALYITRMTKTILRAIELTTEEPPQ